MFEDYIPEPKPGRWVLREVYDWVETGMVAVVLAVLMFTFVIRVTGVEGDSMQPTLDDQDRLVITRLFYTPQYGDIVVITKPNHRDEPLVKRIIAVEGQTIDIDFFTHEVRVDGVVLPEDYISAPTQLSYDMEFPQVVPEGHVFVMGDNRNNSWDSRDTEIGMIDERYIMGKVIFRVLPYEKLGPVT